MPRLELRNISVFDFKIEAKIEFPKFFDIFKTMWDRLNYFSYSTPNLHNCSKCNLRISYDKRDLNGMYQIQTPCIGVV